LELGAAEAEKVTHWWAFAVCNLLVGLCDPVGGGAIQYQWGLGLCCSLGTIIAMVGVWLNKYEY
jgi:hypothetical protein